METASEPVHVTVNKSFSRQRQNLIATLTDLEYLGLEQGKKNPPQNPTPLKT